MPARFRRITAVFALLWLAAPAAAGSAESLLEAARRAESQHDLRSALALAQEAEGLRPNDAALLQTISRYASEHADEVADRSEKERLCRLALDQAHRACVLAADDAVNVLSVAIAAGKLARLSSPRQRIEYAQMTRVWAERALRLDPDYALAHHVLGRWHHEVASLNAPTRWLARMMGGLPPASLADAVQHLRRATELAPDSAAHHAALGFALLAAGQRDAARMSFAQAVAVPARATHDLSAQAQAREALAEMGAAE